MRVDLCVFVSMYIGQASHVVIVIILLILLKALLAKLFGGKASIIILEIILNIQERLPTSSMRKKLVSHIQPKLNALLNQHTKIVTTSSFFEWILQSPIPILVTDPLPVIKSQEVASDQSADGYVVQFDPCYSENDLMANRHYNDTHYSQELKLATYPVANVFMPYRYHMESYKTLINYAQTHPKANEYLKEVTKESIGKMIKFTTESGMVASAVSNDMNNNTSTIKHRVPLVMVVPLRILSSHQGTQQKKRYSRLKNKAEIAKKQKEQRKPL
jgi:hypothetical protein